MNQITAVVSDGVLGIDRFARAKGWIHQRCHCHLVRILHPLLGLRWQKVKMKEFRLAAFELVKIILTSKQEQEVTDCLRNLRVFAYSPACPTRFGLKLRGFIRSYNDFRNYLTYPELRLPKTTNSAERICGMTTEIIRRTRSFRNQKSYQQWVTLYFKLSPTIQCNGEFINRKNKS